MAPDNIRRDKHRLNIGYLFVLVPKLFCDMKQFPFILLLLFFCSSCIQNTVDAQFDDEQEKPRTLRSLMTKSGTVPQEDSLTMMSKLQSDVDNLMMGRVIMKDGIFVLTLKREDALFLGVSEDVYDRYLDYVDRLNEQLSEK